MAVISKEYVYCAPTSGSYYMHESAYESYIQQKIDSENKLALAMREAMVLSEADYSNIRVLQEAKLGDKLKAKWKQFVAFIKGLAAKFMESMTNILLNEKDYLEKYKDIILRKKPKENLNYSYTGNYTNGINRIINTELEVFNYETYKAQLNADGVGPLVEKLVNNFKYDSSGKDTLAEQLKNYYLDIDDGQKEGKFSELNFTDMYNFCYNFAKIKNVVDKDIQRLEASTKAIEQEITKAIKDAGANPNTQDDSNDSNQSNDTTQNNTENNNNSSVGKQESGAIRGYRKAIWEAEDSDKPQGLKITSADVSSKVRTTNDRDTDTEKAAAASGVTAAKDSKDPTKAINDAASKWISVCNPIISAKWTACQQIAKDYMAIIRAHVRSYGGQDKNDKTGNTAPQQGTEYAKDSEKAKAEAEKAKEEANK